MPSSKAFKSQGAVLQYGDKGDGTSTVWTTVAELKQVQRSGQKSDMADVTNLDSPSAYREKLPTLLDAGEVTMGGNYLGNQDASQGELQTLFDGQTLRDWKVVLPNSFGTWTFKAYVTEATNFDLQFDKEATFTAKLTITGPATFA